MSAAENLERLKALYQAWHDTKGGSVDMWLDLMADDVDVRNIGEEGEGLGFAKDRRSKAEAREYFEAILEFGTMVHWTPETFVADDDHIAMFGQCAWRNKATGKIAEGRTAHLCRFRDGLIVEFTEVFDTARAVAAATPD